MKYLENVAPGEYQKKDIENITKISPAQMTRIIKKIREPGSKLNCEVRKLKVSVEKRRPAGSFIIFFVKRSST